MTSRHGTALYVAVLVAYFGALLWYVDSHYDSPHPVSSWTQIALALGFLLLVLLGERRGGR